MHVKGQNQACQLYSFVLLVPCSVWTWAVVLQLSDLALDTDSSQVWFQRWSKGNAERNCGLLAVCEVLFHIKGCRDN